MIGILKENKLHLLKRVWLETQSLIRKVLPLKDMYSFITACVDGNIYLCDLSMKKPK